MSRVAVVTGGGSGIGEAVARHLGERGHRVAVLDVDGDASEHAAADLRGHGVKALGCAVDVSDRAAVDDALAAVRREFGPVEIMVTSAGIAEFAAFTDITLDAWNAMIAVNLTGTFHCLQAAIPDMVDGNWGRIVTIASSAGQIGSPRQGHYAASKGGVIALTKTVAREYGARGITANTIPPFIVDTPMSRAARREQHSQLGRRHDPHPRRAARDGRRHRRRVRVPVLRRSELHHRPGDRRQRRCGRVSARPALAHIEGGS